MKPLLPILVSLILVFGSACLGKHVPDCDLNCVVDSVEIKKDEIIMIVSGTGTFVVTKELDANGSQLAWPVSALLRRTSIVIPKEDESKQTEWNEDCERTRALLHKSVKMQIATESVLVVRGNLTSIKCIDATWRERK